VECALKVHVRARVEWLEVEGIIVEYLLSLRVPREEDGESPVEEEAIHYVRAQPATRV
jgi:hypothetical protein